MKLLTLNTHSLIEPDYEAKREIFVDFIAREQPEVFALQEVNQTAAAPLLGEIPAGYYPCPGNTVLLKADKKADNGQAERIIALLGGRENIVLVDACMTRLRVTVKDPAKVADLAAWKAEGALSLLVKGDGIQAVYGPKADVLKSDINDIL